MDESNVITGNTIHEIWAKVEDQFRNNPDPLQYTVILQQPTYRTVLDVDIDLGGGFESGYETTTFSAYLPAEPGYRFAIHTRHFTDTVGKFFGMEDIVIGYPEFDDKLIIKTDNAQKVHFLFSNEDVRRVFLALPDFTFGITHHHVDQQEHKSPFLELRIEKGITAVDELRNIYSAFYAVLSSLDNSVYQP